MKILFLHGLQSNNKSTKVFHIIDEGHEVLASNMNYFDNDQLFREKMNKLLEFGSELMVGSNMAGYFAYHTGTHNKTNLLLLHSALPNGSFDLPILPDGIEKSKIQALVGDKADVVDKIANKEIFLTMSVLK